MAGRRSRNSFLEVVKPSRRGGIHENRESHMSVTESILLRSSSAVSIGQRKSKSDISDSLGLLRYCNSKAYHLLAMRLDGLITGKPFTLLMACGLMTALFLPDMCVVLSIGDNLGQDVILSMVMALFVFECFILTLIDGSYIFSFYWLMDIVGTGSMLFDISFLGGTCSRTPRTAENTQSSKHLMLIRAARAARVGARAGRLAKVLRMMRFDLRVLPCFEEEATSQGIASVISAVLASSVSSRVAALNIILVMAIPLYSVMTSTQYDYSLQVWVARLSLSYKRTHMEGVHHELQEMVEFYRHCNFGPYTVCMGRIMSAGSFVCQKYFTDWKPTFYEPYLLDTSLFVHDDKFMVGFNLESAAKSESSLAIMNCLFILITMVSSGLTLSGVVTRLAVQPLNRMLCTIRQIAATVFKFVQDDDDDSDEDEDKIDRDVEGASEMDLLDKIVQKLAAITEIHKKGKKIDRTEDMRDEDIGILSMMQGKTVSLSRENDIAPKAPIALQRSKKDETVPAKFLEEIGVDQETFQSMEFNIIQLGKAHKLNLAFFTISTFHAPGDGFVRTQDEKSTLKRFINAAEKEYKQNPFHNLSHATDCCHMVAKMLRQIGSDDFLMELEQFALLIAAISHDLGHPGVNNAFLSEIGHELALRYNDRSPLENMHCSKLYVLVAEEDANVFGKLTREQYKEVRRNCIETILHTDMLSHGAIVNDLTKTFQANQDVFTVMPATGFNVDQDFPQTRAAEIEIFNTAETKVLIMNNLLHSADVSNPCRKWDTAVAWGYKVIEEFFSQGDEERRLGIPVQFLNDRTKLNKPNSQIGFIEFMMAPFYFAQIRLWPSLTEFGQELVINLTKWEEMWVMEVNPGAEEQQKVRARVKKVMDNFADARRRSP